MKNFFVLTSLLLVSIILSGCLHIQSDNNKLLDGSNKEIPQFCNELTPCTKGSCVLLKDHNKPVCLEDPCANYCASTEECLILESNPFMLKCVESLTSDKNIVFNDQKLINYFKEWALTSKEKKLQYELKNVSLSDKPLFSENFFDKSISHYAFKETEVCPMIKGSCWKNELGYELSFDIQVNGISLPSGYVIFNSKEQIIDYFGPLTDIPTLLSVEEAFAFAQDSNICKEKEFVVSKENPILKYGYEGPIYLFSLEGKLPEQCFEAACIVNAVSGETKIMWMCGGLAN